MTVTLLTAGVCGLIFLFLSWRVVQVRQIAGVSIGDGGDALLLARIRAHANFAEYVPICLILIAAIEITVERPPLLLWIAAAALLLVRLSHAIGMARNGANLFRVAGIVGTWVVMIGLSLGAIYVAVTA